MGVTRLYLALVFAFINFFHYACRAAPGETAEPATFGSIELVDGKLCQDMKDKHVLVSTFSSCARLRLVRFSYINFDGDIKTDGMMVVLDAISPQVSDLFRQLLEAKFPIKKAILMNAYNGDDDASMTDNNTSAFNDRRIPGRTTNSLHSYGAAIDINPVQNPYLLRTGAKTEIKPPAGARYLDRSKATTGMAEPVVQIFENHGFFIWGGAWKNPKDFQHFQVSRDVVQKILALEPKKANEFFDKYVQSYKQCIASSKNASTLNCKGNLKN
jgi:hypothetical protein